MMQSPWILTTLWCALAAAALWTGQGLASILPWLAGGRLLQLQRSRRESLAWSFLLSALLFLIQAMMLRAIEWPGTVDLTPLLARIPLHTGLLIALGAAMHDPKRTGLLLIMTVGHVDPQYDYPGWAMVACFAMFELLHRAQPLYRWWTVNIGALFVVPLLVMAWANSPPVTPQPSSGLIKTAQLAAHATSFMVTPDLRCGVVPVLWYARFACQSATRFPDRIEYRFPDREFWSTLHDVRNNNFPPVPASLLSPLCQRNGFFIDVRSGAIEIRVSRTIP